MSWLEDYNGEGTRWWHVIALFFLLGAAFFLIFLFGGEPSEF